MLKAHFYIIFTHITFTWLCKFTTKFLLLLWKMFMKSWIFDGESIFFRFGWPGRTCPINQMAFSRGIFLPQPINGFVVILLQGLLMRVTFHNTTTFDISGPNCFGFCHWCWSQRTDQIVNSQCEQINYIDPAQSCRNVGSKMQFSFRFTGPSYLPKWSNLFTFNAAV